MRASFHASRAGSQHCTGGRDCIEENAKFSQTTSNGINSITDYAIQRWGAGRVRRVTAEMKTLYVHRKPPLREKKWKFTSVNSQSVAIANQRDVAPVMCCGYVSERRKNRMKTTPKTLADLKTATINDQHHCSSLLVKMKRNSMLKQRTKAVNIGRCHTPGCLTSLYCMPPPPSSSFTTTSSSSPLTSTLPSSSSFHPSFLLSNSSSL